MRNSKQRALVERISAIALNLLSLLLLHANNGVGRGASELNTLPKTIHEKVNFCGSSCCFVRDTRASVREGSCLDRLNMRSRAMEHPH